SALLRDSLASSADRSRPAVLGDRRRRLKFYGDRCRKQTAAVFSTSRPPAARGQYRRAHLGTQHWQVLLLCAWPGGDRAAYLAFLGRGRLRDGRRHFLDRRRDDSPGCIEKAGARDRPFAAIRRRRNDRSTETA